jgi:putative membrane protein
MIDSSTELARERSREAADRTLMACIRTALALIGFGCGAGKFYGDLHDAGLHERLEPIRSTLSFGASFEGLHRPPGRGGQAVLV